MYTYCSNSVIFFIHLTTADKQIQKYLPYSQNALNFVHNWMQTFSFQTMN
jgi:hypothetical protein